MSAPTYDLCLINPPAPWLVQPHAQAPLGLLYVAAAARAQRQRVCIRNLAGAGMEPAEWRIEPARVYGITGTYLHVDAVNALANELKRREPDCRVIVGGPIHLSSDELDAGAVDTIVRGDGEKVIGDQVAAPGAPVVDGPPAEVEHGLWPARDLWPGPFGGDVFIGRRRYFGSGSATICTTRGCPHACAFCAGPALRARTVRWRDPGDVVREMERIAIDYGVRQFRLTDEFFTCRPAHAYAVCEEIRRSGVFCHGSAALAPDLAWRASIGVRPNDVEMFRAMHAAGCREVAFGVESADPAVLDLLCRKGGPDDAARALANAREAGLRTKALLMVGLPGTTERTGELNAAFLAGATFDAVAMTVFTPMPGCAIHADPAAYGCRVIEERAHRSVCAYGPQGRNDIRPTIEVAGLGDAAFARQMRATIEMAEGLNVIGRG